MIDFMVCWKHKLKFALRSQAFGTVSFFRLLCTVLCGNPWLSVPSGDWVPISCGTTNNRYQRFCCVKRLSQDRCDWFRLLLIFPNMKWWVVATLVPALLTACVDAGCSLTGFVAPTDGTVHECAPAGFLSEGGACSVKCNVGFVLIGTPASCATARP